MGERPYFEKECPPSDPDDPYTVEAVREALSGLVKQLDVGKGSLEMPSTSVLMESDL
jgi:hypothetical protein